MYMKKKYYKISITVYTPESGTTSISRGVDATNIQSALKQVAKAFKD